MLTGPGGVDMPTVLDSGPEGEGSSVPFVSGQMLVQFKPGTSANAIQQILQQQQQGSTIAQTFYGMDNLVLVNLPWYSQPPSPMTEIYTKQAVANWSMRPEVEYAQPNRIVAEKRVIPDDTLFPFLWGMNNGGQTGGIIDADIDAPQAWDIFTGTSQTVVAVIDSGVQYNHPDLRGNMWVNPGEIPNNLIDDDGNGYIDDVHGAAPGVAYNSGDPMDLDGHGTHVAGTIGAVGNNDRGVVGVNWDVSIMAVNIGSGPLGFTEAAIVAGISYVTQMKVEYGVNVVVSNNSWGGNVFSLPIRNAFVDQIAAGIVMVAAAGNDDSDNDTLPSYPDGYDMEGIIAVAASNPFDVRSDYSNYGLKTVDLFAPGGSGTGDVEDILSTVPTFEDPSGYAYKAGTSMASPHVAGAVALLRGWAPDLTVLETKQIILDTVDVKPQFEPYVLTGGRLNLYRAMSAIESTHVQGKVWADRNGDGVQDAAEPGIANWTVYVDLNSNGKLDPNEPSAVTDATGVYDIKASLAAGTYHINQVVKPRWTQTYPAVGGQIVTINERGDIVTGVDFGNLPMPGGVSGFKWNDADGDGVHDPGEPGIAGVYIYADLDGNGTISLGEPAAITAANGAYVISDIPAGLVNIREVLSPGWTITYPALGYHMVDVIPTVSIPNIDFANKSAFDFGDAPAPYPTLVSQGGASAGLLSGFHLGTKIDAETNGLPNATATGDNLLNLDDEDGVVISRDFYAGTTATIKVTATATARPAGYLQGWVDFNDDGDWADAGEHIIVDRSLGTGVYDISFPVPGDVTIGNTFARFRYSMEKGVGPAGHTLAGEVEDYAVRVLADEPVANPDSFEVLENSIRVPLDVMANDFPSATRVPFIVSVEQPSRGTVVIAANKLSLFYTPTRGTVSPPLDEFTYTIGDGSGVTSTARVSVLVLPSIVTPTAVDDVYYLAADSSDNKLRVLVNDLPGVLRTMQIVSVTNPAGGSAAINDNGTPSNPLDDYILYSPDAAFNGADTFQYTIGNGNGTSTATVTIFQVPPPDNQGVEISFEVQDLLGNPITQIKTGNEFALRVSVQDIRRVPANLAGMYAVFMDILFDRNLVSPNFNPKNSLGFEIAFSPLYQSDISGDIDTPGLLNEVGSIQTGIDLPLGPDELAVFRVLFTANAAGVVDFKGDPADSSPFHDILYYEPETVAPLNQIRYGLTSLTIVDPSRSVTGGHSSQNPAEDVNNDATVSPVDALMIINHLNSNAGSGGQFSLRLDVNRDSSVSPLDALMVINFLNTGKRGAGEGEGEGSTDAGLLSASGGNAAGLLDVPAASLMSTTIDVTSPAVSFQRGLLPASAVVAPEAASAADWQLQIGQSADLPADLPDMADLANDAWESLLDTLAEDVLEAWLDGEVA